MRVDLLRRDRAARAPRAAPPGRSSCAASGSKPLTTGLIASTARPAAAEVPDQAGGDEGLADVGAGRGDEERGHALRCRRGARMRVRTMSASRSISASGCCAVKVRRRRAVPAGTVGGRMATTRKPSLLEQPRGGERRLGLADDDRHDRALRLRQPGAAREGLRLCERQRGIAGLALDQVERGDRGGDDGRRQAGRIDQRARAVADQVDHRGARRRDSRHRRRSPSTACPSAAARRPSSPARSSSRGRRRPRRGRGRRRTSARRRSAAPAPRARAGARGRRPSRTRRRSRSARADGAARCSASSASTCADVVVAEGDHGRRARAARPPTGRHAPARRSARDRRGRSAPG